MTIWVPVLSSNEPRYRAIATAIAAAIASGELSPGQRLPPQRRLADALSVTVGTVTRGYGEAERQGWVQAKIGSGTYVRDRKAVCEPFLASRGEEDSRQVDLSLSLPPPHPQRAAMLGRALKDIGADGVSLERAVAYQEARGIAAHREELASWMQTLGMAINADELLITQGGQHGISLVLTAMTHPGERIAADALTYPGLIGAAQQAHLKLVGVPLDQHGMDMDALARLCAQQPPRLVYVTPDQNNPTGACLSETRRSQLAELARRYDFWIIEDGVQYLPEEARGTPLFELIPERTLYVFSTAKVLAGGLRIGMLRAPEVLRERLEAALRAQSWMVPPLMIEAVCRWVGYDDAGDLLAWQTAELTERQALARRRLAAFELGGRSQGANLWLKLPSGVRSAPLIEALGRRGIRVASAEPFCVGSQPAPQALRLCLSAAASQEALVQALDILCEILEQPPLPAATL